MSVFGEALSALATHLGRRREAMLQAWRRVIAKDPALTTGASLPPTQVYDHIPALLAVFEAELRRIAANETAAGAAGAATAFAYTPASTSTARSISAAGSTSAAESPSAAAPTAALASAPDDAVRASEAAHDDGAAHGLQRWHQGYDLREVTRELGRLNESVVVELDEFACANAGLEPRVMPTARRVWAALCSTAIEESTAQFFHLQQREAAGHLGELEKALQAVRELDQERTELWRQAAHDLRGNLSVVANATAGLAAVGLRESAADQVLKMLQRNVGALHHLLNDVTSLARLQAGQEQRQLARIDVAALLSDLSEGLRPFAQQRHLFLHCEGPAPFHVDGDAVKIRRIAQNLMLNAIKYTVSGGLNVTWGNSDGGDGKRWALGVRDTGPGLHSGSAAPVAQAIENATQAQQSAEPNTPLPNVANRDARSGDHTTAGEGIGLSIVKRLCDLLDATVELESTPGVGTTFRILLPRAYSG